SKLTNDHVPVEFRSPRLVIDRPNADLAILSASTVSVVTSGFPRRRNPRRLKRRLKRHAAIFRPATSMSPQEKLMHRSNDSTSQSNFDLPTYSPPVTTITFGGRIARAVRRVLAAIRDRYRLSQDLNILEALDDRTLKDIGLHRSELEWVRRIGRWDLDSKR